MTLIVAMDRRGVIGRAGGLPWRLPDDLRRFKALTMGKPVIMGRKTFESIGRPLPQRRNLVISRGNASLPAGVERFASLDEALRSCATVDEVMVIGGAEIYRLALPRANRLELTQVEADVDGDTRFPPIDMASWRELRREYHPADAQHAYPMSFLTWERITEVADAPIEN
jgi:dihydrofolate reductase